MIINEKALLRLMKACQKSGGYWVAMTEGSPAWIYIHGTNWYVGVQRDKLPRKALALLVEHMGEMPYPGVACKILKDVVQDEFYELVTEPIFSMNADGRNNWTNPKMHLRPTPLTWRETKVWQRGDGKILLMNPDLMDLAIHFYTYPTAAGSAIFFDGGIEQVYIVPEMHLAGDEEFIKTIGATMWVPGKDQ